MPREMPQFHRSSRRVIVEWFSRRFPKSRTKEHENFIRQLTEANIEKDVEVLDPMIPRRQEVQKSTPRQGAHVIDMSLPFNRTRQKDSYKRSSNFDRRPQFGLDINLADETSAHLRDWDYFGREDQPVQIVINNEFGFGIPY